MPQLKPQTHQSSECIAWKNSQVSPLLEPFRSDLPQYHMHCMNRPVYSAPVTEHKGIRDVASAKGLVVSRQEAAAHGEADVQQRQVVVHSGGLCSGSNGLQMPTRSR